MQHPHRDTFYGCMGLTSETIPNGVADIGNYAFKDCSALSSIIEKRDWPATIGWYTFENVNKTECQFFVPVGSKTAYENASGWKAFQNVLEHCAVANGSCGVNVTYTIYSDMTMVISGTGEMCDYGYSDATAEYQLELSDIKSTFVLEDCVVGDTNGDGKVLVGDVIAVLNIIVNQ